MIGGLLTIVIAAVGAAYAALVIRAAPTRRDNLMFGVLALTDASMILWRGVNVLSGESIVSASVTLPCSIGTIVMALITMDFLSGFPRRPAMRWRWRLALIAWGIVGFASIAFVDAGKHWDAFRLAELTFFLPSTAVVFVLGAIAWRRTSDRDARTVIAMLWFRWGFGLVAYTLGPLLGVFEEMVWAETTVATLLSFVIIGTAVLRSDLFSIRSAAAEAVLATTMAFGVVLSGGGAIFAVLRYTAPGALQTALLIGATLVPLHVAVIFRALYPRLEKNVLAGLDERRARRLGMQGEPIPVEPTLAIDEACKRISSIGDGATVRWQTAAQLPPALATALKSGEPQRKDETPDIPACFVVPALGADRSLVGAFMIEHGTIDRDTYVVARDLAARIALVVERQQAISELEDARRLAALGSFAAAIAHDIRTPLTSISLNVQILRRKLQLSDDDREHLDIALEELARLDKSVAEILDFAKPVKLVPQAIDVGELIETTTRGLSPVLSEKGVSLHCEPQGELPTVHGDPQRLRQVLVNLVGNAADASTPGTRVTVRASIYSPAADAAHVAIEVEDKGRGIKAEDLPRIFEPFFTTRPDGTGLGLAICHKVVRAHGGDIQVRSAVGEGSTFTILLPAA
ncbi:MAG TPA: ATP-binding protein [Kofleriaceae bacterium]|nr:ATP-binding protein [Kofleriaceae bacterium]